MYNKEENLEEFVVSLNPGGDGGSGTGGNDDEGSDEGDREKR